MSGVTTDILLVKPVPELNEYGYVSKIPLRGTVAKDRAGNLVQTPPSHANRNASFGGRIF